MSSTINQDSILSGKVSTQEVPLSGKVSTQEMLLSGKVATLETLIGPPGPQGPKGDPGDSYTVKGLYATLSALQAEHPTGSAGDAWFVGTADSNVVYQWDVDKATWVNVGAMKGPKGDTGDTGPQGEKGDSGVYVGAGDMPEGYNVQIDPSGSGDEIVTAENIQSALGYTPADSADLADKLPKSPADWEQWTAEEQAAARERIAVDVAWQCVTLTADDYDAENHRFLLDAGEGRQITEIYGIGQVVTDTPADVNLTVGIGFGNTNNTTFGVFGVYSIPTPNTHTSFSFEGKSVDFTSVKSNVYSQFGTVRYSVNKHDTPDFYIYASSSTAANQRSNVYWNNNNPRYFSIFGLWGNVTWAAIKIYIKMR